MARANGNGLFQVNKHHHEPLKKKKEQDERRRKEQEIEMLTSAGQLPLPDASQEEAVGFKQVPDQAATASPILEPPVLPASAIPLVDVAEQQVKEIPQESENSAFRAQQVLIEKESQRTATPPVPDEIVRAARAAPRLVPPFTKDDKIKIDEGRLAEEGLDGSPLSRSESS